MSRTSAVPAVEERVPRNSASPSRRHAAARPRPDPDELDSLRRLLEGREQLCLLLEELLEASTDGVVALDFRGRVVHISGSLLDPSPGTADGRGLSEHGALELASPEARLPRSVRQRLRREAAGIAAGDTVRFELTWPRPDRGTETYRVTATAGSDFGMGSGTGGEAGHGSTDKGRPGRLLTLFAFFDRTREATLERELAEARNLAALGQMAATVAHELRNPLGAIQGFAGLLSRDLAGQPVLLRQAERILRGVEGANRIVSDLLEYTRPVAPRREPVSLPGLLEESIAAWRASTPPHGRVEVDLCVDPDLPDCLCDGRLVQQALQNLYANAVQAMGEEGAISVRARAAGPSGRPDRLRVVVRDTGCGLNADEVARIFQPFYTTNPGGTGLGLPLVRRIVEAHGGHVHVVSAPGRGTSVVIDLPAAGVEMPDGGDAEVEVDAGAAWEEKVG
jgi:signal transduction histidine kinase